MKYDSPADFAPLLAAARQVLAPRELSRSVSAGQVAAALVSPSGKIYTGVCIDAPCSMGFCAEHAAIAALITAGESQVLAIVAVNSSGQPIPPCGRCREFLHQIHDQNGSCRVLVKGELVLPLSQLLPYPWN